VSASLIPLGGRAGGPWVLGSLFFFFYFQNVWLFCIATPAGRTL